MVWGGKDYLITPSILSADFAKLGEEVDNVSALHHPCAHEQGALFGCCWLGRVKGFELAAAWGKQRGAGTSLRCPCELIPCAGVREAGGERVGEVWRGWARVRAHYQRPVAGQHLRWHPEAEQRRRWFVYA